MSRGWIAWLSLLGSSLASGVVAASNPWTQPAAPLAPGRTGPALEIADSTSRVALPAIPSFAVPTWAGGLHNPLELLIVGDRLRGTRVRVGGYVTWIYDCTAALAQPGKTRAQIQKRIDGDPSLCERPKFYLGDARDTPPDRSLWVVDVPRPPNKLERERLPAAELARWPAVPRLAVGAYVEVTGTFALRSPHDEANSDGLIVYEAIDTLKAGPPEAGKSWRRIAKKSNYSDK